jgi:acyl-CoA synthetase (AMP-forming)/AMP-acid ligase II
VRIIFAEREFLAVAEQVRDRLAATVPVVVVTSGSAVAPDGLEAWKCGAPEAKWSHTSASDDPVLQMYTSGTTGFPKGAVLAHRTFFAVQHALLADGLDWIDWHPQDVSLVCAPATHIGGVWWAVQGLNAGVTNVVMRAFTSREAVKLCRDLGVTLACLAPAMLSMLLAEPELSETTFRTLRKIVYGGSPISESLLLRCLDVMGCDFAQIYGLTETGNTAVCLPPADHLRGAALLQAAGRPYPGFAVKIIGRDGAELAAREVGEVCLRTPARMLSYWKLPDATASTLIDGWIHTGDVGYLDENGYLFICDRVKDMIIRAGENIYPAEVENAITGHPAVADAAVVGIPDRTWGEAVLAFVILRPGAKASPRELREFLLARIAEFKIPSVFRFVDDLPRSAIGKILRRTLRDPFWAEHDRKVN